MDDTLPASARKPLALRAGDVCMVVSPSWGGPAEFPNVYEAGLRFVRETLGLIVRESRHARAANASVAERVSDLHEAFADPSVRLIATSIGGDDSIRLLPHLNLSALSRDPKIVLGYSDTTTLLTHMARHGLVSFYGPSIMSGLAQAPSFGPAFIEHVRRTLCSTEQPPPYQPYGIFHDGYEPWATHADTPKPGKSAGGPRVLQGRGHARGTLFGGCLEILELMEGTPFWPMGEEWRGKVLFFETSEEAPPPKVVQRALRAWGVSGMFERLSALLVGRPRDYSDEAKLELDRIVLSVVRDEFAQPNLPIMTNLDFGHTDPQWILPLGVDIELDVERAQLRLCEAPVLPR
jgi:muramoyltetrapeptide carboxypeptidase LdcA involved in peptidoglycan recycling